MGLADVGLVQTNPWIMVQAKALPDVTPTNTIGARSLERSIQIENDGHTLVHEVGHAFGLFHTFENGCKSPGDYIPDTPYQSTALSRLPSFFSTLQCCALDPTKKCASEPTCKNESGDNFDNFMDYSPEACTKRFTPDQIAVMQATLLARRPNWVGSSKKKSLRDVAVSQEINGTTKTILGNFKDSNGDVDLAGFQECQDGSSLRNVNLYNAPFISGQLAHVIYHLNVPDSSEAVKITQCEQSDNKMAVSLTYLECVDNASCTCQTFQCTKSQEYPISLKTLRSLEPKKEKAMYLIISSPTGLNKDAPFRLAVHTERNQIQPVTSTDTKERCVYDGSYTLRVPNGACKYRYLSAPLDCQDTKVALKSKKQMGKRIVNTYWDIHTTDGTNEKMKTAYRIQNAGKRKCDAKYLAAANRMPSLGRDTLKYRLVPASSNSCDKIRLVIDEPDTQDKYVTVTKRCGLKLSSKSGPGQIFGIKDDTGTAPEPVNM